MKNKDETACTRSRQWRSEYFTFYASEHNHADDVDRGQHQLQPGFTTALKLPADTPKTVAELSDEPGTRATALAVLYLYPRIPVAT